MVWIPSFGEKLNILFSQPMKQADDAGDDEQDIQHDGPQVPPQRRFDHNAHCIILFTPHSIVIGSFDSEPVITGRYVVLSVKIKKSSILATLLNS
jgi:hypothetical protein